MSIRMMGDLRSLRMPVDLTALGKVKLHHKGEHTRSGAALREDSWILTFQRFEGASISDEFDWIGKTLLLHSDFFSRAIRHQGVRKLDIFLSITAEGEDYTLHLLPESIGIISELTAGIDVSFVLFGSRQKEEEPATAHPVEEYRELKASLKIVSDNAIAPSGLGNIHRAQEGYLVADLPPEAGDNFDDQVKWIRRAISHDEVATAGIAGHPILAYTLRTNSEWPSAWISRDVLRFSIDFLIPLDLTVELIR